MGQHATAPTGRDRRLGRRLPVAMLGALLTFAFASAPRVAVGASPASPACPAHRASSSGPSIAPGATGPLVPPGPSAVLLCRYAGLGQGHSTFPLLAQRDISAAATVANLVGLLNRLHPQSSHVISCPFDNGTEMLAFFSYPTQPALRLTISLTGCEVITNGHVARTASLPPGATLLARLTELVG